MNNNNITVRIYFEHGQKVKGLTLKQKLFHNGFSHYILKAAREAGVKQAISFHITAGYLAHHLRIQAEHPEVLSLKHPQCIELTGKKERINSFLDKYKEQFENTEISILEDRISLGFPDAEEKVTENYKRVLIAVDGSENSLNVTKKGIGLAKLLGSEIALVFVVDKAKAVGNTDAGIMPNEALIALKKEALDTLDQLIKIYGSDYGILKFMPEGNPKDDVLQTAEDWCADLIVVGMHGKSGFALFAMGSIAQHIVLHSKVPVIVVPERK
jgi:nucleotide-binding universal stress UspA family protein/PII-like signaling protein